jgi:hypothetical protein
MVPRKLSSAAGHSRRMRRSSHRCFWSNNDVGPQLWRGNGRFQPYHHRRSPSCSTVWNSNHCATPSCCCHIRCCCCCCRRCRESAAAAAISVGSFVRSIRQCPLLLVVACDSSGGQEESDRGSGCADRKQEGIRTTATIYEQQQGMIRRRRAVTYFIICRLEDNYIIYIYSLLSGTMI